MHWKILDKEMQKVKEREDPSELAEFERRREPRMPLTFPLEVSGLDRSRKFFTERTSSLDVGEFSCAFVLQADVEQDSVVAVRSFHWQNSSVMESQPVLFQVTRVEEQVEGWIVATVRLQS
jgi:hypothetical protein